MPYMEHDVSEISSWTAPIAQGRDVLLAGLVLWTPFAESMADIPPAARPHIVSDIEVEALAEMAQQAAAAGRLIDFGFLPNSVIRHGGKRGGPLWNRGALHSPFADPWVFRHSWDAEIGGGVAFYLVNPKVDEIEIVELQPTLFGAGRKAMLIGDRVLFKRAPIDRYYAVASPNIGRFYEDLQTDLNLGKSPEAAAVGNVGDPLMTALLILATRNVERETIRAPDKLQAARVKRGQKPIPPHDVVNSAPYVTAIKARGERRERGEGQGGTHRSPIPHIRMGHPREYASGRTIFVQDTLVGVREGERLEFKRSHYSVKRHEP